MNRILKPTILALILALLLSITVSAQDSDTASDSASDSTTKESKSTAPVAISLDGAEGTLDINHEMTVMAEAELNIGGQIYMISIPATVVIDTQQLLAEVGAVTTAESHVGPFSWHVLEVIEDVEYEEGYTEVEASGDENKLVIVRFEMTNMADETLGIWDADVAVFGVDDLGKVYESSQNICDDIDPGETLACTWIFDVPADVNMVDTKVEALQTRQLSLSAAMAE